MHLARPHPVAKTRATRPRRRQGAARERAWAECCLKEARRGRRGQGRICRPRADRQAWHAIGIWRRCTTTSWPCLRLRCGSSHLQLCGATDALCGWKSGGGRLSKPSSSERCRPSCTGKGAWAGNELGGPMARTMPLGRRRKPKPLDGVRARKTGLSVQPQHSCGDQFRQRLGPEMPANGEERQGHRDIEFVDFSSPQGRMNMQGQGLPRPPNIHALQGRSDPCEAGQCGRIGKA